MLKKLVALTLVALMVINPMTAMAVTWDSLLQGLAVAREQGGNKYEDEGVMLEVEGTSAKIYGDGLLENFYKVEEFTSYTFSGNITVGGETFEVYVYDVPVRDENGTPVYNEDGSMQMQAQQAVVNIESGVAITATEVRFGVDDNSTLKVTTKGSIGFDADGTLVTEHVSFDVSEDATANAEMTVVNEGDIATIENIWMGADGEGTIHVTNDGTMTAENEIGMHVYGSAEGTLINNGTLTANASGLGEEGAQVGIGVHGEGTATMINSESGVINSELSGWLDSDATNGTLNMTNDGTVNGNVGAWGFEGGYEDEEGNWVESTTGGAISLENTGDITGSLGTFTNDNISSNVINSGTAESMFAENNGKKDMKVTVTKDGTAGNLYANAFGNTTLNVQNDGIIHGDLSANADGIYDDDNNLIEINGGSTVNLTNNGTAENIYSGAVGAGTITVTNNNTVNNELVVDTINGTVNVVNNSTVGGQLDGWANGKNGSVTVINTGNGTVGSGEEGNGIWVSAENGATVEGINAGTVNGELGGGAYTGGDTIVANLGTADSSWVESYDGGNLTLDNSNVITETPVAAGNSKITVVIATEGSEVTDTATVGALYKQSVVNWEGRTGETKIITTTQDGQPIALYSVAADGTIVLEEVLMEQGGGDGDDPRFWTKERIRHDMEEKRKAAEIGGVYGSPYWLKQLYLGYMSLNLRLFDGEEQLLFKENISWVPGANVAGEKILTLNVKIEDTSSLAMRLDGAVIDKLEQADIVTINIVDGAGNLFMEYQVEDLKGAREMYGLTAKESIVVGSADADVMKIAEDGTISPIEGETEAEPAA